MDNFQPSKILAIDDEPIIRDLLRDILRDHGYNISIASTGKEGLEFLKSNEFDLVFLDIKLPDYDGLSILNEIKKINPKAKVIIMTAYPSLDSAQAALRLGAFDYITKPFSNINAVLHSAKKAIEFKSLSDHNEMLMKELEKQNLILEQKVNERTQIITSLHKEQQDIYLDILTALCGAVEAKDSYTNEHSKKVALYSIMIADEMKIASHHKDSLVEACKLHDLGKIGIPDLILKKQDELTKEEWEIIKTHPLMAVEILKHLTFLKSGVVDIIYQHHERFDGKGYPVGLKEQDISIGARILSVADTFDALYSIRPYRVRSRTKEETINEIKSNSGTQFDPKVVEAFLNVVNKF